MNIILIAAMSRNNAIGVGNELPWHLPDDFKFFKATTLGYPILMGRKTLESLGKPLPGRTNVVITSDKTVVDAPGLHYFETVEGALEWLEAKEWEKIYVIGGGQIFAKTMAMADELLITEIDATFPDADVFFPEIDHSHWTKVTGEFHPVDERHNYAFTFCHYKRVGL